MSNVFTFDQRGATLVVSIQGRLTAAEGDLMFAEVEATIAGGKTRSIVVDFTELSGFDAAVMTRARGAMAVVERHFVRVVFVSPNGAARFGLSALQLATRIKLSTCASLREALALLAPPA